MLPKGGRGSGKGKKAASAKGAPNKSGGPKPAKKRTKKPVSHQWTTYIQRTLKQLQRKSRLSMSSKSITILGSFVEDIFERLHSEAVNIAKINKHKTLSAREMQTSTRLLLPGDLAKHAMSEGTKAVAKYNTAQSQEAKNSGSYFD